MPAAGDSYENPRTGARLEVLATPAETGDGSRVFRRTIKPGQGKVAKHYHLDFAERFAVESGTATAKVGRERVTIPAGEELVVPVATPHLNPYNDGEEDLVMIPLPAAFAVAYRTVQRTFAAGAPQFLQRRVIGPLGDAVARLRGYEIRV
jgi:mannose-6-phosphate isomerase-like protein (cupin superfamily)